ncbi:MAG: 16S rRNA (cytosine(967)-C(5))-methyltransferase RsmB [Gemmatimonadetes bacterium]|nr:16S rRNA (cytosine(967)-C(5))-methyltransferase RsmB [Gemmatimonadota bacterium]
MAAARLLADLRDGALLDAAFDRHAAPLPPRDRRWVQELCWGVLRRRSWLDAVLAPRIRGGLGAVEPGVLELLRLGVQQLVAMDSVPPYAAIGEAVALARAFHGEGAAKLVNAVLRRVDRERATLEPAVPDDAVEALALAHSHPAWLVARWVAQWGPEEAEALLRANNIPGPIMLRPHGVAVEALATMLAGYGVEAKAAPLVSDSLALPPGIALADLPPFTEGRCYVQDAGATLVARYAHVPEDGVVADLCAAPGGKALELARRARLVVAADRQPLRVNRMLAGFGRLDADRIVTLVADATHPAVAPMDAVLVDVPCTGTGTFRRHPDARWRLRVADLAVLSAVQREILEAAATAVRPGGLLVYSTCSIEPEENDAQVDRFLAAHPAFVLEPPPPGTVPEAVLAGGRLRVLPHRHGTDGAFAARLRRSP